MYSGGIEYGSFSSRMVFIKELCDATSLSISFSFPCPACKIVTNLDQTPCPAGFPNPHRLIWPQIPTLMAGDTRVRRK